MTLTFTSGSITSTASEQTVWDVTADENIGGWIFTHNMTSGDTITIKVYVKDTNGSAMRTYLTTPLSGVQSDPAFYLPFVATREHKVTIQRTAGSDRAYTWQRIEATL